MRFFINVFKDLLVLHSEKRKIQCEVTDKRRPSIKKKDGLKVRYELMFSLSETVDNSETILSKLNSVSVRSCSR